MDAKLQPRFSLRMMLVIVVIVAYFCMIGVWVYDGLPVKAKLGRLSPGMTTAEVEAILGRPVVVLRTTGTKRQSWVYDTSAYEVFFEDDKYTHAKPFFP
jgi:outer membrane protein assembly factor BamE (lipoprotein component of BamABCDE complex)